MEKSHRKVKIRRKFNFFWDTLPSKRGPVCFMEESDRKVKKTSESLTSWDTLHSKRCRVCFTEKGDRKVNVWRKFNFWEYSTFKALFRMFHGKR